MHQITGSQTKAQIRLSESPTARKPRSKRACFPLFPMLAKHQGGIVRSWLARNVGLLCIAFGWLFAFWPIAAEAIDPMTPLVVESFMAACFLFGFAIAWIIRDETKGGIK